MTNRTARVIIKPYFGSSELAGGKLVSVIVTDGHMFNEHVAPVEVVEDPLVFEQFIAHRLDALAHGYVEELKSNGLDYSVHEPIKLPGRPFEAGDEKCD